MRLESTFRIPVPAEVVFDNFLDVDTMRQSVPGCTTLDRTDPNTFRGELSNQVAHVKFNATFAADITSMQRPHQIRAVLSGEDRRLGSTLRLDAELDVVEDGADSVVSYAMEVAMWGKLGRMGEAIFRRQTADVQQQFVDTFTRACLGELVPATSVPSPVRSSATIRPVPGRTAANRSVPRANGSVAARAAPMIGTPSDSVPAAGQVATSQREMATAEPPGVPAPSQPLPVQTDHGVARQCLVALSGGFGAGLGMGLAAVISFAAVQRLTGRTAAAGPARAGGGG